MNTDYSHEWFLEAYQLRAQVKREKVALVTTTPSKKLERPDPKLSETKLRHIHFYVEDLSPQKTNAKDNLAKAFHYWVYQCAKRAEELGKRASQTAALRMWIELVGSKMGLREDTTVLHQNDVKDAALALEREIENLKQKKAFLEGKKLELDSRYITLSIAEANASASFGPKSRIDLFKIQGTTHFENPENPEVQKKLSHPLSAKHVRVSEKKAPTLESLLGVFVGPEAKPQDPTHV